MSTHARHIDSTNPERVRVMVATGSIKGDTTTLRGIARVDRHRRLPPSLRETLAWNMKQDYRLLRDFGISRTIARMIVRTYAHMASMGMRWPHENGRAGEQTPNPTGTPEESEAATKLTGGR